MYPPVHPSAHSAAVARRRVIAATIVGTTVEWYDFFIFSSTAALVFQRLFFEPAGPQLATLWAMFTIGLSFLFRPLGAFLAGHFGDRLGRKPLLVITLLVMGVATSLVGLLPTYDRIGLWAPVLLMALRILQGLSAGGEWGGAVLMAVEHAPHGRRGVYGMYPQLGVPLGLLLASGMTAVVSGLSPLVSETFFDRWGWRIPFLVSILLIFVGYFVRRSISESPVFLAISSLAKREVAPIVVVFARHRRLVLLCALLFAGNGAAGYMTAGGFLQSFATRPLSEGGTLGMDRTLVLGLIAMASAFWMLSTLASGHICDAIGRRWTFLVGWSLQFPAIWLLFPLVHLGPDNPVMFALGVCIFAIPLGLTYGPIASWFAEVFPASVRFSGVSISYAIGAVMGGAFAPFIAQSLLQVVGSWVAVGGYLSVMTALGLTASLLLPTRDNIPLNPVVSDGGTADGPAQLGTAVEVGGGLSERDR